MKHPTANARTQIRPEIRRHPIGRALLESVFENGGVYNLRATQNFFCVPEHVRSVRNHKTSRQSVYKVQIANNNNNNNNNNRIIFGRVLMAHGC